MQRFFSIAIILNWLAAIALIGMVGFGMSSEAKGLMAASAAMFSDQAGAYLPNRFIQPIAIVGALSVLTAALWALMAVLFADSSGAETDDQDFVITAALGFCLMVFAFLLVVAAWHGNAQVGALASIASFATILAGIAHRICVIEVATKNNVPADFYPTQSMARATSMASQSAILASAGSRTSRFVPKRPYQP